MLTRRVPRRRARLVGAAAVIALLAAGLVAAPSQARGAPGPRPSGIPAPPAPELGPLVSGTHSYVEGVSVWTDYVYDDRGPNSVETSIVGPRCTTPEQAGGPACSGGDATYPSFAAPGNAADIVQLQLERSEDGDLFIRAVLETLVDVDLPLIGVAIDADADPATGAAELPGDRWNALDALGVDTLVTISTGGTEMRTWDGDSWEEVDVEGSVVTQIGAESNLVSATVDDSVLPEMSGAWRTFGVAGIRDPESGDSWLDGSSAIYDLAYVGNEPFVRWQENRQADILQGNLSSTNAAFTLDWSKLDGGVTELADTTAPGFHTYLYHSELELPEGVTQHPTQLAQHEYLGPYQPYLVFIPEAYAASDPLAVWLHGANNNHFQSIYDAASGNYIGTARQGSEDYFLVAQFQPDATLMPTLPPTPTIYVLGRGETLGYQGISEVDVLEATDDAIARLGIDPNRVSLQGASMGGIGSYRLGVLYPDRWSTVVPVIGSGASYRDLFQNLRNVPVRQMNGKLDSGSLGPPSEQDAVRLDELGYPHHYWLVNERGHEVAAYYRCVLESATTAFIRDPNPHHVTYTVDPDRFQNDPNRDIDITYSSAYWVSGLVPAGAEPGTVDVTSEAIPHTVLNTVRSTVTRNNMTSGQDFCGPNPDFAPGWTPVHPQGESWLERSLVREQGLPLPTSNLVQANLAGLGAATFDLARANIDPGRAATVEVETDGPADVTLTGLTAQAAVALDGQIVGAVAGDGTATVAVPGGAHIITIRPEYQPDVTAKVPGDPFFLGEDFYADDGTGQVRPLGVPRRQTALVRLRVQNDGVSESEAFTIQGPGSTSDFKVRYFAGGEDVTAAVVSGTYETPELAVGKRHRLNAEVKARKRAGTGAQYRVVLRATSTTHGDRVDAAGVHAVVVG